jgi:hypothetical protein
VSYADGVSRSAMTDNQADITSQDASLDSDNDSLLENSNRRQCYRDNDDSETE